MPAITFTPKAPVAQEAPATQLTIVEPVEMAVVEASEQTLTKASSNIDSSDIILPRLNLVQKVGKLCDNFPPGSIVFEQEVIMAKPDEEMPFSVLSIKKYYSETVVFGSGEFGRRVGTEDEVKKLGGTTMYGVDGKTYWPHTADILMVIQAPKGISEEHEDLFPFEFGGDSYAMAAFTVSKSSYTSLAKRIFTDQAYTLKAGLHHGEYRLKSDLIRNSANSWYVPVAGPAKKIKDPAKVAFFAELIA